MNFQDIYSTLPDRLFVTGIGTDVGKTYVSAGLCRQYQYAYWKPIQCGDLDSSDSAYIREHTDAEVFSERYRFHKACSPHEASALEGIDISLNDFTIPSTPKLIVEGAGGLLVPLNAHDTIADLIKYLHLPACLVIRDYLGCINHSLLTVECLLARKISTALIVFNGSFQAETRRIIEAKFKDIPNISID